MQTLRLIFTGHVDHGKSTLIGRLLYDTGSLSDDRLAEVRKAAEANGGEIDFAFVMDHLREERDRKITIDTSQFVFHSPKREVVIIDAPGHKEFLKNMMTGASQADAAVLVVDAREGIQEQTRRHAFMLSLLGLREIHVAVNKMDLVEWSESRFAELTTGLEELAAGLSFNLGRVFPICAPTGEGIVNRAAGAPWYDGPTLLDIVDAIPAAGDRIDRPFLMAIQDVYEGIHAGMVASGSVHAGSSVQLIPGESRGEVSALRKFPVDPNVANAGESIGLEFAGSLKGKRGQVVVGENSSVRETEALEATIFWLGPLPWIPEVELHFQCGTASVAVKKLDIQSRMNSSTLESIEDTSRLEETEVADVILHLAKPVAAALFADEPDLGRFVLAYRGHAVGGGLVQKTQEAERV